MFIKTNKKVGKTLISAFLVTVIMRILCSCGGNNSKNSNTEINISSNEKYDSAAEVDANELIPENGIYTVALTGEVLKSGKTFPNPADGDTYEYGDYLYRYNSDKYSGAEWWVSVKDKTKTSYGEILSEIVKRPVTNMDRTFQDCTALITPPNIPDTIKDMSYAFSNCQSLTSAPIIPSSVENMSYTFSDCRKLTVAPEIPDGIKSMNSTFYKCWSLEKASAIPNSVTDMPCTFYNCFALAGTIEINANPDSFVSCLSKTKVTNILGTCSDEIKAKILTTK